MVVIDKSLGGFKEVKSFGVAKTVEEADRLYAKASEWVRRYCGQLEIDFAPDFGDASPFTIKQYK